LGRRKEGGEYLKKLVHKNSSYASFYDLMIHGNVEAKIPDHIRNQTAHVLLSIRNWKGFIHLTECHLHSMQLPDSRLHSLVTSEMLPSFQTAPQDVLLQIIEQSYQHLSNLDYISLIFIGWVALKTGESDVVYASLKKAQSLKPKRLEHALGYLLFLQQQTENMLKMELDTDCLLLTF
jgi:hypothetical protein